MFEELEMLASKQKELDCKRTAIGSMVENTLKELIPLREKMREVNEAMENFNHLQEDYISFSRKTYELLADNIQSVERETLQMQNLLKEGDKLSKEAFPIHLTPLAGKSKENLTEEISADENSKKTASGPRIWIEGVKEEEKEEQLPEEPTKTQAEVLEQKAISEEEQAVEKALDETEGELEAFVDQLATMAKQEEKTESAFSKESFLSALQKKENYQCVIDRQTDCPKVILTLDKEDASMEEALRREFTMGDRAMEISFTFPDKDVNCSADTVALQADILSSPYGRTPATVKLFDKSNHTTALLRTQLVEQARIQLKAYMQELEAQKVPDETENEVDTPDFNALEDLSAS